MAHVEIQDIPNPAGFKVEPAPVELTPDFKQKRLMQKRAQRMMNDVSLPQVVRDNAKSEMIHYSMENIRATDRAAVEGLGKKAVGEHLLIEPVTGEFNHKQRVENIEHELRRHNDEKDPFTLSADEYQQAIADRKFALKKADEDTKTPQDIAKILREAENSLSEEHDDA